MLVQYATSELYALKRTGQIQASLVSQGLVTSTTMTLEGNGAPVHATGKYIARTGRKRLKDMSEKLLPRISVVLDKGGGGGGGGGLGG